MLKYRYIPLGAAIMIPDFAVPRLTLLTPEQIEAVHAAALKILAEAGLRVDSERARQVLSRLEGVSWPEPNRAVFAPAAIQTALRSAPAVIDIYNRRGQLAFHLGADRTRFGVGVTNLYYEDPASGEILPFTRSSMQAAVRLGQALPGYDLISTVGVLKDVPPDQADLYAVLDMLANTVKPLVILISEGSLFGPALDLLENLGGDLATKPWVIPYVNPITPLVLNAETAEKMLISIERGLPVIYSNYGMAGMSTPITPAGTLALLTAELLAGLVFSQAARPGAPIILGSLPAYFDMRHMVDFYDPRTMLLNLACAEMLAHYGLPHAGTSGSGNGWGADLLASGELWLNHLTALLSRAGLAPFVGGSLGSKVFSPAMTVYAHEIIEQALAFTQGFSLDAEATGLDEIITAGPAGSFITADSTLKHLRKAYHTSRIFPHIGLEKWQEMGQPRASALLRQATIDLLARAQPPEDHAELVHKGEAWIAARRA